MAGRNKKKKEYSDSFYEELSGREGKIHVRICGRGKGLEEFENVRFVRLISKGYNLLIMADYLPVIGELDGSVCFLAGDGEHERTSLKGYFMHKNNEFSLMLEEEGDGEI